jgi:diaminopropionate ammonia-lyase
MTLLPPICRPIDARFLVNPRRHDGSYGARQAAVLDEPDFRRARAAIAAWHGYAPTPLLALPGLARALGVAAIHYKDEGDRFRLASFKALGGAYAVERQVAAHGPAITVTCATDGNHGRSVAWGARRAGCSCVIYIHEHVSLGRQRAIEAFGAEVRRVAGTYDDSVRQAAADAARQGWIVVSDTSYPGYMAIPKDVMQGYALMAEEALEALPATAPPTHVFVQGGVGGLAAAVCFRLWTRLGAVRPKLVVVEPELAACLLASAMAGQPVNIPIEQETVMAGLSCGEPSLLAWEILDEGADAFMAVPDHAAEATMRLLADGTGGDAPIVAGESAVAGLAGAITLAAVPTFQNALDLGPDSRILVFGTEGDTDPEVYARIVGRSAAEVRAGSLRRAVADPFITGEPDACPVS